jgi:BirA family biotin operon repressor/biotin-[acetyl-CoA-carboxylase] ligase
VLSPELLDPLIAETIFAKQLHYFARAESTNSLALAAGGEGAPEGSAFLAEEQTAGRGRGGHVWHSAPGDGIYCSVLLRPVLPPARVLLLSLATSLAVRSAILEVTGLDADLKWPNDVFLGNRKICGILTEMSSEATRVRHIVVGIGINVNHAQFPDELREEATSLYLESRQRWSRVELLAALLKSLDREYRALVSGLDNAESDKRASILHRFQEHSTWTDGCAVRIEDSNGFTGITEGLDTEGFLLVRTPHGQRTIVSGTVRRQK